jgi:hypothetical protein
MRPRERGRLDGNRIIKLQRTQASGARLEARKFGLTRIRIVEIALALLLTIAALLFVALTVWAV